MIIAHPHPGPLPQGEGVIEGVSVSESLVLYDHYTLTLTFTTGRGCHIGSFVSESL
jgi:hypothetical protein